MESALSEKFVLHRKRNNPFTSRPISQVKQGMLWMDMRRTDETLLSNHPDPNSKDTDGFKPNKQRKQNRMTLTTPTLKEGIPANVLDFLGDCVVYSGRDAVGGELARKGQKPSSGDGIGENSWVTG